MTTAGLTRERVDWFAAKPDFFDPSSGPQPECATELVVALDLFFPAGNGYAEARAICERCPLRWPCGEWAIATGQEFGMWGGLTPEEIKRLRVERNLFRGMRGRT